MTPEEQLKVLAKIWGRERDGYVFLPWIPADIARSSDARQRRAGWRESRAFKWPKDRERILTHLQEHKSDDLFFTPHRFLGRKRVVENIADEVVLFADFDDFEHRSDITTPEDIPDSIKPTICWQTSTGNFQGVWTFNHFAKVGVYEEGRENQALTYYLGADRGGWHASKVLRVPGSFNNKHDKQERGKVLWYLGDQARTYTWDDIDEEVPNLDRRQVEMGSVTQEMVDAVDPHEALREVRFKLDSRTRRLLRQTEEPDKGERSEVMYSIAQELSDAGANFLQIVSILQASVWNKHSGEPSEIVRLVSLASKVQTETKERIARGDLSSPEAEPSFDPTLEPVSAMFTRRINRPHWLVDGLWAVGGCGWVAGAPKSYKSWLTMHLATCIAAGVPFMGRKVKKTRTLVIQQEDPESTVVDRLDRVLDGSLPEVHPLGQLKVDDGILMWEPPTRDLPMHYKIQVPGFDLSDQKWKAELYDLIQDNNLGLVVIDTLFATMGSVDIADGPSLQHLILAPLKEMASELGCAVMIVHHSTKSGDGSRSAQLLGSQALRGWADCGIYFGERDKNRKVPVDIENKHGSSHRFGIDVSSLSMDDREPEILHTEPDGYQYTERYRSVWSPFECLLENQTDEEQYQPSTPKQDGGSSRKNGSVGQGGKGIAKILANIGVHSEARSLPYDSLVDKATDTTAKRRSEVKKQVDNAIYNGWLIETDEGYYAGAHAR